LNVGLCPDWNDDSLADASLIVANIKGLRSRIEADARSRPAPSIDLALGWHRAIYAGVTVPHPDYVGNVRDSDPSHPCLVDYEVTVGGIAGTPARDVPAALDAFVLAAAASTSAIDLDVPVGSLPSEPSVVAGIIQLSATMHGKWIQIHPFANGNGRIARLWANWIAIRYGLPAFVRVKPRPDDVLFAGAARLSMQGDYRPTEALFASMLRDALRH
jgi:Fic/DOC family